MNASIDIDDLCSRLRSVSLKNFASKHENQTIDEKSPKIEVNNGQRQIIVKKTSLCWLLRKDPGKLSSDRLERVKNLKEIEKRKKSKPKKIKRVSSYKLKNKKISYFYCNKTNNK